MKIKRLDLLAFGPFTKMTLDLSEGNPGLHVILGPNEAGKSSTLRALKAWLFGIEARSTDNFVHENKQLRVGGVLETSDGKEIDCVRRKGNKDTLLSTETEEPIGNDALSELLPGLDEKLFSQLHGIDHAGLVQGGHAILEQSGDLGKSLFGAALGGQRKNDLVGELVSEADSLFKARGQNQSLETLQQQLHQSGEGHTIDELEKEAQDLDADEVGEELSQLDTRLSDLASDRDAMRDQRQTLLVQIQALDGSSKAAEAAERAGQLLAGIVSDAEQYLRLTIARLILQEQMERYRQEMAVSESRARGWGGRSRVGPGVEEQNENLACVGLEDLWGRNRTRCA